MAHQPAYVAKTRQTCHLREVLQIVLSCTRKGWAKVSLEERKRELVMKYSQLIEFFAERGHHESEQSAEAPEADRHPPNSDFPKLLASCGLVWLFSAAAPHAIGCPAVHGVGKYMFWNQKYEKTDKSSTHALCALIFFLSLVVAVRFFWATNSAWRYKKSIPIYTKFQED